ncbi:MAG: IclR family transcriptional regulator C-terminal domain-containing protein, partial [Novosphingobium sp.]
AQPVLRRLHEETGEVVYLSILHGSEILYVVKIDPIDHLATAARAGVRVPAIFTASGKALLAHQPDPDRLINDIAARIPSFDPERKAALLKEMEAIRAEGCAHSVNGWTAHATSLAVAVPNANLPPVAAIGIVTLSTETSRRQLSRFAALLHRSAAELSAAVAPIVDPA